MQFLTLADLDEIAALGAVSIALGCRLGTDDLVVFVEVDRADMERLMDVAHEVRQHQDRFLVVLDAEGDRNRLSYARPIDWQGEQDTAAAFRL